MKKALIALFALMLLSGCVEKESASDFTQCGIMYQVCPEGYETQFIGGQCMRCYLPNLNITFNLSDLEFYDEVDHETVATGETAPTFEWPGEDMYCVVDPSGGNHCTCDVIVYDDGTNESVNCQCWNDLVVHYECFNISNATVFKNINFD